MTPYKLDFAHDTFGLIDFGEHELSKPIRLFAYHWNLDRCEKYSLCFELNTNGSERVLLRCAKSSYTQNGDKVRFKHFEKAQFMSF